MKCKGLFERNDVVMIPVTDEPIGDMMRCVKSYASYNGLTIKTECGIFIKPDTMEVEKVIRCEVVNRSPDYKPKYVKKEKKESLEKKQAKEEKERRKLEAKRLREERRRMNFEMRAEVKRLQEEHWNRVVEAFQNGMTATAIAEKFQLSRQGVYDILDRKGIKRKTNRY